jgi:hypothetical protein
MNFVGIVMFFAKKYGKTLFCVFAKFITFRQDQFIPLAF